LVVSFKIYYWFFSWAPFENLPQHQASHRGLWWNQILLDAFYC
jgi:hypothetical protein